MPRLPVTLLACILALTSCSASMDTLLGDTPQFLRIIADGKPTKSGLLRVPFAHDWPTTVNMSAVIDWNGNERYEADEFLNQDLRIRPHKGEVALFPFAIPVGWENGSKTIIVNLTTENADSNQPIQKRYSIAFELVDASDVAGQRSLDIVK